MVRYRVRIRFCKQGDLRWIGHRDLMRCLERLFRRAELPLGLSEGFHPKPRMTFPLALAVGIEGTAEVMELELTEAVSADRVAAMWAKQAPAGLEMRSAEILPPGAKKARVRSVCYRLPIPPRRLSGLPERIERLWNSSTCPTRRPHRGNLVDVRKSLLELSLRDDLLSMRLDGGGQSAAGPRDVLTSLELSDLEEEGCFLTRNEVEIHP